MLKQKYPNNYKSNAPASLTMDADTLVSKLKIFIWQIIARNNAETLTDPLFHAPNANTVNDEMHVDNVIEDVKDIKPTLDEIMPAPTPAQDSAEPPKKKISAKDLIADADVAPPIADPQQITMSEVLQEPAIIPQAKQAPQPQQQTKVNNAEFFRKTASIIEKRESPMREVAQSIKERYYELKSRYYEWRIEHTEHKDYFKALQLQIANKNVACYEILDYLESLQEEE